MTRSIADEAADTEILSRRMLGGSFRRLEDYTLSHRDSHGAMRQQKRELLAARRVIAVIAYDPAQHRLVLLRQYRFAAHLATGRGRMVEIVAGAVEDGEEAVEAARREMREETGLVARAMRRVMTAMPTPGLTDETADYFLALVDASNLPARAGEDDDEDLEPFLADPDDAIAAADAGALANGFTLLALNWFARCGKAMAAELEGEQS